MNIHFFNLTQSAFIEVTGTYTFWQNQVEDKSVDISSQENERFHDISQGATSLDQKMFRCIHKKTLDAFEKLYDTLWNQSNEEEKQDLRDSISFFRTVAQHYIANACDSVFKRLMTAETLDEYSLQIALRLELSKTHLRLEVEDNGLGIDPTLSTRLFHETVSSKKEPSAIPKLGGVGVGLLNVQLYSNNLKGNAGFIDKGQNKGAIFIFEAPITECRIKSQSESYRNSCRRNQMYRDCAQS